MGNSSFSVLLPNLIIGLCKGSLLLLPHSAKFKFLGYEVFRLEQRFKLATSRYVHPDATVISSKVSTTLLFEWSDAKGVSDGKKDQISRSISITPRDLVDIAAIPKECTTFFAIPHIVNQAASTHYVEYFIDNKISFPLLSFSEEENGYILTRLLGTFPEPQTDGFFQGRMVFRRIPLSYLPFSLEDINVSSLVEFVCQHLVSLIVKDSKKFALSDFCSGFIPMWSVIDIRKKDEVADKVREVLRSLMQTKWGLQLVQPDPSNKDEFKLSSFSAIRSKLRSFRTRLREFIKEQKNEPHQEEMEI